MEDHSSASTTTPPAEADRGARSVWRAVGRLLVQREILLLLMTLLLALVISRVTPYLLTSGNLKAMLIGMAPSAIIAVGTVIVLVGGGLDLSVGSVMALSGTLAGLLMLRGLPIWLSLLLVLLAGAAIGLVNGLVITRIQVNPLIATLGMMTIARGIAFVATEGFSVTGLPDAFAVWGQGSVLGVPPMVFVMIVIVLLGDLALRKTKVMREVYYVGGNERAALLSGIPVPRVKIMTYVLSSVLSAVAGILVASRLMSGTPTAGLGLELNVIAAAVIGGASLIGGEGTVLGAFLGTVFITILGNIMILLAVSIYWQGVASGIVLITVVGLDMLVRTRRGQA
ncbi:MAG TPA: ABC transporter permease [bacterium]|nr:ABC transporter permease [bacterium]